MHQWDTQFDILKAGFKKQPADYNRCLHSAEGDLSGGADNFLEQIINPASCSDTQSGAGARHVPAAGKINENSAAMINVAISQDS